MKTTTKKSGTKKAGAKKKTTTKKGGSKKTTTKKASTSKKSTGKRGTPTPHQKKIGMAGRAYTKALHNELAGHTVSYVELEKAKKVAKRAFDKAYGK